MQSLYSFFQHEKADMVHFEKEMFKSLDKVFELYLSILALVSDIHHVALVMMDENKNKRLPNSADLDPNLKFVKNTLLIGISENKELKTHLEKRKISWQNDFDIVRKLFVEIRNGESYKVYMESTSLTVVEDRDFVISMITEHLSENEVLISLFE